MVPDATAAIAELKQARHGCIGERTDGFGALILGGSPCSHELSSFVDCVGLAYLTRHSNGAPMRPRCRLADRRSDGVNKAKNAAPLQNPRPDCTRSVKTPPSRGLPWVGSTPHWRPRCPFVPAATTETQGTKEMEPGLRHNSMLYKRWAQTKDLPRQEGADRETGRPDDRVPRKSAAPPGRHLFLAVLPP